MSDNHPASVAESLADTYDHKQLRGRIWLVNNPRGQISWPIKFALLKMLILAHGLAFWPGSAAETSLGEFMKLSILESWRHKGLKKKLKI